jgi:hypothetical protein
MSSVSVSRIVPFPVFLFVAVVSAHCGSSNGQATIAGTDDDAGFDGAVEGGNFGQSDASPPTGLTCKSIGATCALGVDCCVNVCTGGACGNSGAQADGGAPKVCNTDGQQCAKGFDCCSGTCNANLCVGSALGSPVDGGAGGTGATGPLSCDAPNAACKVSADCCSGLCEPVTGQAGVIQCRDACRADGVACATAQDCCSLGCFGGICTNQLCIKIGDTCAVNTDCCSGVCDPQKLECVVDQANSTCRPTGEDCGAGPQSGCCGATKDDDLCVNGRCALPPGACKGLTASCTTGAECCNKNCDPTTHTCALPVACVPAAGACTTGADCCTSSCTNGSCDAALPPGAGGGGGATLPDGAPAPTLCDPTGASCTSAATCCSGLCLGGFCDVPPPIH